MLKMILFASVLFSLSACATPEENRALAAGLAIGTILSQQNSGAKQPETAERDEHEGMMESDDRDEEEHSNKHKHRKNKHHDDEEDDD
jgi:hypothetical protein